MYRTVIDTATMARDTEIVMARRQRLRAWIDERFDGVQSAFLADAKRQGHEINQGELSGLLRTKSFSENRARRLETQAGMPVGYLVSPLLSDPSPATIAERLPAAEDMAALQMAMRSLTATMLHRLPGTAEVFRDYLERSARASRLPMDSGLLASLAGIADEALDAEAAAGQALQHAHAGGRKNARK